jgi:hypothetical protein
MKVKLLQRITEMSGPFKPLGKPGRRWEYNINLLKPAGYAMHQLFNIQQLYALSILYLSFVFISEQTATCATYTVN